MKNSSEILLALLAGSAIGVGLGLLYAPNKGVDTRRKIAESTATAKKVVLKRIDILEKQAIQYYQDNKGTWDVQLLSLLAEATGSSKEKLIASLEQKLGTLRKTNKQWQKSPRIIDVTTYSEDDIL